MGSSDRGCCARPVASTSTGSQIRPWHNAWLPNQAPRSRMLRSQLGGWACQARPLRLYASLRNVHPESTSWEHQAHEAGGACFQRKVIVIVCTESLVKNLRRLARQLVTPQLMGRAVRELPLPGAWWRYTTQASRLGRPREPLIGSPSFCCSTRDTGGEW